MPHPYLCSYDHAMSFSRPLKGTIISRRPPSKGACPRWQKLATAEGSAIRCRLLAPRPWVFVAVAANREYRRSLGNLIGIHQQHPEVFTARWSGHLYHRFP